MFVFFVHINYEHSRITNKNIDLLISIINRTLTLFQIFQDLGIDDLHAVFQGPIPALCLWADS